MLRRLSAYALGGTGLATALIDSRPLLRTALVILCYHRVVPMRHPDEFPFDSALVSATPAEFAWQMRFIRRHFNPIDSATLLDVVDGGRELPPRAIFVTFDDGYDDCVKYVLPVLRAEGVPGCVFVATGLIGARETYWFDELALALQRTTATRVDLPEIGICAELGSKPALRREIYGQVVEAFKSLTDDARLAAVASVKRQCPVRVDEATAQLSRPMDAQQIVAAARDGLSIQSHTVTHPVLRVVDAPRLHSELSDSRDTIAALTGETPRMLAYPNGTWNDFGAREIEAARDCGYRAAMTYESGIQVRGAIDPFRLLRLPVNWRHSRQWFRTMLAVPELAAGAPPPHLTHGTR
jgi:peptidoglycan/xylan/chitin deacetylase (PgdA/CDA1 family)